MSAQIDTIESLAAREYQYGFITDIGADSLPPGLNEDVIRVISAKKNEPEFMLEWRLRAFEHLENHVGADLGQHPLPADRLPENHLLLGSQVQERRPQKPGRSRS